MSARHWLITSNALTRKQARIAVPFFLYFVNQATYVDRTSTWTTHFKKCFLRTLILYFLTYTRSYCERSTAAGRAAVLIGHNTGLARPSVRLSVCLAWLPSLTLTLKSTDICVYERTPAQE